MDNVIPKCEMKCHFLWFPVMVPISSILLYFKFMTYI